MADPTDDASPVSQRPRRVTAQDVADAAGVSRSAVSRAFTPGAYLDGAKRDLILKTAIQIGYQPNVLAASLRGSRTHLVAVIAGDLRNYFDNEFLAALVPALIAANKWPLVLGGENAVTAQSILAVLRFPLDALIIRGGSIGPEVIQTCEKLNIPMIFVGSRSRAPFSDSVACDNRAAGRMAVDLLLARGRRAFGYLGGPPTWASENERLEGVVQQLTQNGLALVARQNADFTLAGGREVVAEMLSTARLDALICANDAMALSTVSYLRQTLGLSVPEALSVVGFDDMSIAAWPEFELTTVRNPIGQTVADILTLLEQRLLDPRAPGRHVVIEPVMIERGTH